MATVTCAGRKFVEILPSVAVVAVALNISAVVAITTCENDKLVFSKAAAYVNTV